MPEPQGLQWYKHWQNNIDNFVHGDLPDDPKLAEKAIKEDPWSFRSRTELANAPQDVQDWATTAFFSKAVFPTETLQSMDRNLHPDTGDSRWDPNPNIRRRQKMPQLPKDAPNRPNTKHPDFLHEMMKGTGVPEHVTVYHHGDIPDDAKYASGSVSPDWSNEVKSGWRSKDPSINRGRLHIYLVPHEDILSHIGGEQEVFFRRGESLRKTPRTKRQQKIAESLAEDQFQW